MTSGERGHVSIQDLWLFEKHATSIEKLSQKEECTLRGWGAWGEFTVTHDISKYTRAKLFSKVGNKCKIFSRMSTAALGMLFNRMTDEQKLVLFKNAARNMGDSTKQIKHRYIRNFYLAAYSYGKEVAEAL